MMERVRRCATIVRCIRARHLALVVASQVLLSCGSTASNTPEPNKNNTGAATDPATGGTPANAAGDQTNTITTPPAGAQKAATPVATPTISSAPAAGKLGSYGKQADGKFHDCRDDWPEFKWEGMTANECAEAGANGKGEGFLPSIAFKACKINGQCTRLATMDECHSYPFPRGGGMLPQKNDKFYCLEATDPKDRVHRSESYYSCYLDGVIWAFQAIDAAGELYRDQAEMDANPGADVAGKVADNLAFLKSRPACDTFPADAPIRGK